MHRAPVGLADEARGQMEAARALVEHAAENTYGVNTGFGRFVSESIPDDQVDELQLRLLRSHACGVGEPYPDEIVRAALLMRANTLAKGYSGTRPEVAERLLDCLAHGVLPEVPSRGSVGASGDLAPLAHLALPLVGEGQAWFEGTLLPGDEALAAAGLEPVRLGAKEGLSLINGTQFMAAMASLALVRAWRLARTADLACALSLESLQGSRTSFHPAIHQARPLPGQVDSAANLHRLLEESAIIESHRWCDRVQDAYSLRCAPQVHGASKDGIRYALEVLVTEANSVTDNPLVFADGDVISGGNFHGQPVSQALDFLAIAVSTLANISERRIEQMVNPDISGLPPFLARNPGLESGFMIPQVVAASLASENKSLAHPASVDTIPTSANREDHVSMGVTAARHADRVVGNTAKVLGIEVLCAAQGLDLGEQLRPGKGVAAAYKALRKRVAGLEGDRYLAPDLAVAEELVVDGTLVAAAEKAAGVLAV